MYDTKSVKAIYDNQTAISDHFENNLVVYGVEKAIILKDCTGMKINILNTLGQNIIQAIPKSTFERISLYQGVYFVTNGVKTIKVIVK